MDRRQNIIRAAMLPFIYLAVSGAVTIILGKPAASAGSSGETILTGIGALIQIPLYLFLTGRWGLSDPPRHHAAGWLLLSAAAGSGLSLLYGWISGFLHLEEHFSNQIQENLYSASVLVQLAVLCFLVPVCEELLFRRLIFGCLKRAAGEIPAAAAVSALFSLMHGDPIQMIYAFPMALVMQALYHAEGRIEAPLVFHIAANLTSVLLESILR